MNPKRGRVIPNNIIKPNMLGAQPRAKAARYDARKKVVVIELANGASFAFPPSLAQGLEGASAADLSEIEITPMGTGLH